MDSDVSAPNREGLLDRVFHGSFVGVVARSGPRPARDPGWA
jgi:hypothetical protein